MSSLTCPTPEDLARWVNDGLDPVQRAEIGTHVDTCNRCQWAIEELTDAGVHGLEGLGQLVPAELPHEMSETTGPAAGRDETADREHERRRPTLPGERADPVNGASDRDGDSARAGRQDRPKTRFTIPSYDILEEIGTGGMGVVYKARQRVLNRLVALKMIRGRGHVRPDQLARIRIEAEAVARLRHANIVQIYEIGEVDGLPFLSLELLEGERSTTAWRAILSLAVQRPS